MARGFQPGDAVQVPWRMAVLGKSAAIPQERVSGRVTAVDGDMVEVEIRVPGEREARRLRLLSSDLSH